MVRAYMLMKVAATKLLSWCEHAPVNSGAEQNACPDLARGGSPSSPPNYYGLVQLMCKGDCSHEQGEYCYGWHRLIKVVVIVRLRSSLQNVLNVKRK